MTGSGLTSTRSRGRRRVSWPVCPALWVLARILVRRRRGDPASAEAKRSPTIAPRRRYSPAPSRRAQDAAARGAALREFLAARTGELPEAWLGRDAARVGSGLGHGRGERTGPLRKTSPGSSPTRPHALDRDEWGGRGRVRGPDSEELLGLADRLVKGGL